MQREPKIGELVEVTRNSGSHPCRIGERVIVSQVDDSDDTLKGVLRGTKAVADFWIPYADVEPVRFGWAFARRHLPSDLATLLEACDGIEFLKLSRDVKECLVDQLPDWKDRVLAAIERADLASDEFDDLDDEDDD